MRAVCGLLSLLVLAQAVPSMRKLLHDVQVLEEDVKALEENPSHYAADEFMKHFNPMNMIYEERSPIGITTPVCKPSLTKAGFLDYLDVSDPKKPKCGCVCLGDKQCYQCPDGRELVLDPLTGAYACKRCPDGTTEFTQELKGREEFEVRKDSEGRKPSVTKCKSTKTAHLFYDLTCPNDATSMTLQADGFTCTTVCEAETKESRGRCAFEGDCGLGEVSYPGWDSVADDSTYTRVHKLNCVLPRDTKGKGTLGAPLFLKLGADSKVMAFPQTEPAEGVFGIRCPFTIEEEIVVDHVYDAPSCTPPSPDVTVTTSSYDGETICYIAGCPAHFPDSLQINSACGPGHKAFQAAVLETLAVNIPKFSDLGDFVQKNENFKTHMRNYAATKGCTTDSDEYWTEQQNVLKPIRNAFRTSAASLVQCVNTYFAATECVHVTALGVVEKTAAQVEIMKNAVMGPESFARYCHGTNAPLVRKGAAPKEYLGWLTFTEVTIAKSGGVIEIPEKSVLERNVNLFASGKDFQDIKPLSFSNSFVAPSLINKMNSNSRTARPDIALSCASRLTSECVRAAFSNAARAPAKTAEAGDSSECKTVFTLVFDTKSRILKKCMKNRIEKWSKEMHDYFGSKFAQNQNLRLGAQTKK